MINTTPFKHCTGRIPGPANLAKVETNDCAVRALAIAAGLPYDDVHAFLELHGRVRRHGTHTVATLSRSHLPVDFPELGIVVRRVGGRFAPSEIDRAECGGAETSWFRGTLRTFARKFKTGNYLVCVDRHALAVRDGVIYDHTCRDLRRIKNVWKVELAPSVTPVPIPEPSAGLPA